MAELSSLDSQSRSDCRAACLKRLLQQCLIVDLDVTICDFNPYKEFFMHLNSFISKVFNCEYRKLMLMFEAFLVSFAQQS